MEDHLDSAFDKCYSNKYFDDEFELIRVKSAFRSGYKYAISHLWNNISSILPDYNSKVLVNSNGRLMIASRIDLGIDNWINCYDGSFTEINDNDLWMEIPNI